VVDIVEVLPRGYGFCGFWESITFKDITKNRLRNSNFARHYCATLSERMFALVRCSRYLGGALKGILAPIVAPTYEDELWP